jgi:diguanylate cyclase
MQDLYNHSIDKAGEFGQLAMDRIKAESLPCTPYVYELFYNYYSGNDPEVVRSIDIMVSQNFDLTLDRCLELYNRLLNTNHSKEALERAEIIFDETISSVDNMVDDFKNSNHGFSGSINNISSDIAKAVSPDELRNLLGTVISETQKMVSENHVLETKLERSSETMTELKKEMEAVKEEAYTDSLTGIGNRKKFDLEIVRLVGEARENKKPLSMIFIDIDHFKSFNDAYGHQIGDQVLRLVAKTFQESLKGRDFSCRYGGEEFVILLPETDQDGGAKIANILREAIKNKEIKNRHTGEMLTRVTISAGVAQTIQDEEITDWVSRADQALYQAKKKGRDCVVVAAQSK